MSERRTSHSRRKSSKQRGQKDREKEKERDKDKEREEREKEKEKKLSSRDDLHSTPYSNSTTITPTSPMTTTSTSPTFRTLPIALSSSTSSAPGSSTHSFLQTDSGLARATKLSTPLPTSPSLLSSSLATTTTTPATVAAYVASVQADMEMMDAYRRRVQGSLTKLQAATEEREREREKERDAPRSPDSAKGHRRKERLAQEIRALKDEKAKLGREVIHVGEVVSLNVGGSIFWTSRATLTKYRGTMLESMFSGRHRLLKDSSGHYFLDRSGTLFMHIIYFLRNDSLPILPEGTLFDLKTEAEFYSLEPLIELIDLHLNHQQYRFAVLRYNETSNTNNLSWQGIAQPCVLNVGSGSLFKSIDQVLTEVANSGWELVQLSGDGSSEGGWMYVFRMKIRFTRKVLSRDSSSWRLSISTPSSQDDEIDDRPVSSSSGGLIVPNRTLLRLRRKRSGSF